MKQFLLVIRLTAILLFFGLLQVSASTLAQKVTLHERNAEIGPILHTIEKQTGYVFLYDTKDIKDQKVSVFVDQATIDETMAQLLKDLPLEYKIVAKNIILQEKARSETPAAIAAPIDVIGRITNKQGQPLNGATVTIKRTQEGTLTDANGNFTLRSVLSTDTLVISYIGYERQFIRIGDKKDFKIALEETSNKLDQVVIQAYGETSQRLTTGDIGSVTAKDIEKQPVVNILDVLQGQVAGAVVTNTTGYASGTIKVEVRGRNTINPNFPSDPLYIIDGVPLDILTLQPAASSYQNGSAGYDQYQMSPSDGGNASIGQSPLLQLNPSDIESIEVLKDADATAIYGSRGSNGVILITTKKGKAGKTHLDVNLLEGLSAVTQKYQMLNTQQYVQVREQALRNDGLPVNADNAPDLVNWDTTRYTNWQKLLTGGLGKETNGGISLTGGDDKTTFRLGTGFYNNESIFDKSGGLNRGNVSLNLSHKTLQQKLVMSLTANYGYVSVNEVDNPGVITLAPNAPPIYTSNGNLNYVGWEPIDNYYPFGVLLYNYISKTNTLNSGLNLRYELFKNFSIKTDLGYSNFLNTQRSENPIAAQDPLYNPTGTATVSSFLGHTLIFQPQLEYNGFIKKGKLNVLLGASSQTTAAQSFLLSGQGYNNDALLSSISNAPIPTVVDNYGEYKYAALFGRVSYNWEDKYLINFNTRRDGSSRFGPGRQYGNFWSLGGAWIFSEEKWVKNNFSFLSFGKIRGSYGLTGGDQIPDYSYLSVWQFNNLKYNFVQALVPKSHTDSLLHWQVNKKLELAISLGFFDDRITMDASWYRDRCNDQLIQFPTPSFSGFTSVVANSPADVQNTGLEFNFVGKIFSNNDFKWSERFNIAFNRNELLSYPNLSQSPYAGTFQIGQSLNAVKILHYTGVDPETGLYTFETKNPNGIPTINYSGGSDDRHWVDLAPKYTGGLTTDFIYKNFELSVLLYFKKQIGQNYLKYFGNTPPGSLAVNQPIQVLHAWQKPGDISPIAKLTTNPSITYTYVEESDAVYTDASFVRCQNLYFSYNFPKGLTNKLGMSNLRIYIQGENLFVLTKYQGIDPETQNFGGLPIPMSLTMGITCNF